MEVWSRCQFKVPLHRLRGLFDMTAPWALLVLVQRRKDLRLLHDVSLRTKRASCWKHNRLAGCILCRRDALGVWRHLIFEDAAHHLVLLLNLERGDLRLIRTSGRDKSLAWVLRANIVVLEAVPALTTCALALRRLLIERAVLAIVWVSIVSVVVADELNASNVSYREERVKKKSISS